MKKIYRLRLPLQFDVQQMGLFMQGRCRQHWAHPLRVWSIFSGNFVPTHKTVVSTQSLRTLWCFQSMERKTKCGQLIGSFVPRGGEQSNINALRSTNTSPHPGSNHGYDSEGWYRSPYRSQTELELRIWGDYTQTIIDACRPAQGSHSLRDMLPVLDHLLQELCNESHLENKHGQHMQNTVYMICILSLETYYIVFCICRCLDSQHVIPWNTCSKAGFWHVESPTCLTTHQTRTACAVLTSWQGAQLEEGEYLHLPSTKTSICKEKHEYNQIIAFSECKCFMGGRGTFKFSVFLRPFPGKQWTEHTHQCCYFGVNLWPLFLPQAYSFIATAVQD